MKFVTSYSFGKDSALAHHRMIRAGHQPAALLTTINTAQERSWVHGIQAGLMEAVAQSLGLPLICCDCDAENYSEGLEEGLLRAKALGAEACAFGDIDLEDHAAYDRARCNAVGLTCELPLWQGGREALLRECLEAGFKPLVKTVQADILDENFLGQTLTLPLAQEMAGRGADICGENGEYHTFVYDGPIFRHPVPVECVGIVDLGRHKAADIRLV